MSVVHLILGVAVVALCVAAGVQGLRGRTGPRASAIVGWATVTLAIQSAIGMFMLTATSGTSAVHVVPALAGLAAVLSVRLFMPDATSKISGSSFLFAAATSVTAFLTGVLNG